MHLIKPFLLLDRDGTVIAERHYLSQPSQVELLPTAAGAIRAFNQAGYGVAIITNQSGIARGYFDLSTLDAIHARMLELLACEDAKIDGIFVCPHLPEDACSCRKPRTGLIEQATKALSFLPHKAILVGDKESDIALGRAIGAKTFLVRTGYGCDHERRTHADQVVDDLAGVATLALK